MSDDIFGSIIVASDVEEAATATLKMWFPTYLAFFQRKLELTAGTLPAPQNYTTRNVFDAEQGEQIPKVVVISPGLAAPPKQYGNGQYHAVWRLGVGVATAAKDEETANMMVKAYGAAVRSIILQKQALGGTLPITGIAWEEESYNSIPIPAPIMLYKAVSIFFMVEVNDVITLGKGPLTPGIGVPADWPIVETVDIELDIEEVNS